MFHGKLKQKIILTLTLSVFALSACNTVMAARPYGGANRPNHIRTPQTQISRPAGPGQQQPPSSQITPRRPNGPSAGAAVRHQGVPTPHINRPSGSGTYSTTTTRTKTSSSSASVRINRPTGPRPVPMGGVHRPTGPRPAHNGGVNRPSGPRPGTSMGSTRPQGPRPGVTAGPAHKPYIHGPGPSRPPHRPLPPNRPHRVTHYPHWRRSNIVFHYGWPRSYYWWGCRRGISFGEYLLLALMLEGIRANRSVSIDDIYTEHINGASYEDICTSYDLDWYSIQSRARLRYNQMHAYSTGMEISFWNWNDRIYY